MINLFQVLMVVYVCVSGIGVVKTGNRGMCDL